MAVIKKLFWILGRILGVLIRFVLFMAVMLTGAWLLAPFGTINSKDIDLSQFNNHPNEMMMNFFQTEMFSGYLFAVTIAFVLFAIYLFWQLHEVAVHKAQERRSTQIQLVFALSLCGLFLHKGWWVIAIIIAFANWSHIAESMSGIIRNALNKTSECRSKAESTLVEKEQ